MSEEIEKDEPQESEKEAPETSAEEETGEPDTIDELKKSLADANDKYLRLYAEFDNYKKISSRNKEELLKYANEDLISEILTVIDHLELALQHSAEGDASNALAEGVHLTLKELKNVLEKFGLVSIEALGKPFDPSMHHAMSQIETDEADDNTVVKEFRKGYLLKGRVLRAALVGVSRKQTGSADSESDNEEEDAIITDKNENT